MLKIICAGLKIWNSPSEMIGYLFEIIYQAERIKVSGIKILGLAK
jgi:hypothetical protein